MVPGNRAGEGQPVLVAADPLDYGQSTADEGVSNLS
jgi:hypothetical protein